MPSAGLLFAGCGYAGDVPSLRVRRRAISSVGWPVNEPNRKDVRRRARRGASVPVALTIAPILLVFWTLKAIEPHHYPAGDLIG